MPLTDSAIKTAKPKEKPYKLSDAQGLYLLVNPNGSKLWRLKYRVGGKRKGSRSAPTRPSPSSRPASAAMRRASNWPRAKTPASRRRLPSKRRRSAS